MSLPSRMPMCVLIHTNMVRVSTSNHQPTPAKTSSVHGVLTNSPISPASASTSNPVPAHPVSTASKSTGIAATSTRDMSSPPSKSAGTRATTRFQRTWPRALLGMGHTIAAISARTAFLPCRVSISISPVPLTGQRFTTALAVDVSLRH